MLNQMINYEDFCIVFNISRCYSRPRKEKDPNFDITSSIKQNQIPLHVII